VAEDQSRPAAATPSSGIAGRWRSGPTANSWRFHTWGDTVGNRGAHSEIQAIKISTTSTVGWILDHAMQAFGAAGLSQDHPLAGWWAENRSLRYADGPDEVHLNALARAELKRQSSRRLVGGQQELGHTHV
jgi:alkylation response protein AidB-like acyl-CoA dehydrogenase